MNSPLNTLIQTLSTSATMNDFKTQANTYDHGSAVRGLIPELPVEIRMAMLETEARRLGLWTSSWHFEDDRHVNAVVMVAEVRGVIENYDKENTLDD